MPDTLAWGSSLLFDRTWTTGGPSEFTEWTVSIPAFADLGPQASLVFCLSARNTYISGSTSAAFVLTCEVTVSGVLVPFRKNYGTNIYESNAGKHSILHGVTFKYDFAPGATVVVKVGRTDFPQNMRIEGQITAALLRDFTGQDLGVDEFAIYGDAYRGIYPTPDASPLSDPTTSDPAPAGLLYFYAADNWTPATFETPAVTGENSPGWEDVLTASGVGLRSQIGVYAPQSPVPHASGYVTPAPTITGVTGSQAAERFFLLGYSGAYVAAVAAVPSQMVAILG